MNQGNSFGNQVRLTLIGESHGRGVGAVMDGLPAGYPVDTRAINDELGRRRPGQSSVTTTRKEPDTVDVLSGLFNDRTTGAPLCMMVWNQDVDSSKYEKFKSIPRPGHADFPARIKYGGYNDYRGSGRFSGRITAGIVMAGAIASQIIRHTHEIRVCAHVRQVGDVRYEGDVDMRKARAHVESNSVRCYDQAIAVEMEHAIESARKEDDSIGGIIECIVDNPPIGLGNPRFQGIDSSIASMMFSIGGVKGIEFGAGFKAAKMRGTMHNDPYGLDGNQNIVIKSNNAGGVLGGMSTGEQIIFRIAVKPTSSIGALQSSVDIMTNEEVSLEYEGRHDPCIAPRAVPVVESVAWFVLLDALIERSLIPPVYRE